MTTYTVTADTQINLARYMERLDNYIESQTKLNETLCLRLEKHGDELDELQSWKTKFYGAKTFVVAFGIVILHASVVLGSFVALTKLME